MPALIKRHPLVTFFIIAYALTWWPVPLGSFLALGPMAAAFIVTAVSYGRPGLREWGSRIIRWRVGWQWYAVAAILPLAVIATVVSLNLAFGAPAASLDNLEPWHSFLLVFALRMVVPIFAPLGEEPGWRGFALPHLQTDRSPLQATLVLGLLVAIWHVPLMFIPAEKFHATMLISTVAVTFFYTWLFCHTRGSVLLTILAHAVEGTVRLGSFEFSGDDETRAFWL
jgi:membrane protease YdiL (CAAX protease family)